MEMKKGKRIIIDLNKVDNAFDLPNARDDVEGTTLRSQECLAEEVFGIAFSVPEPIEK